jgi:hypothetical protein
MRVINNIGKIGKSPRESNKVRQRKMKENLDMKGVVDTAIKTATSCTLTVYRIREIIKLNVHVWKYDRLSVID